MSISMGQARSAVLAGEYEHHSSKSSSSKSNVPGAPPFKLNLSRSIIDTAVVDANEVFNAPNGLVLFPLLVLARALVLQC